MRPAFLFAEIPACAEPLFGLRQTHRKAAQQGATLEELRPRNLGDDLEQQAVRLLRFPCGIACVLVVMARICGFQQKCADIESNNGLSRAEDNGAGRLVRRYEDLLTISPEEREKIAKS